MTLSPSKFWNETLHLFPFPTRLGTKLSLEPLHTLCHSAFQPFNQPTQPQLSQNCLNQTCLICWKGEWDTLQGPWELSKVQKGLGKALRKKGQALWLAWTGYLRYFPFTMFSLPLLHLQTVKVLSRLIW
jgi:hypothetical protein